MYISNNQVGHQYNYKYDYFCDFYKYQELS